MKQDLQAWSRLAKLLLGRAVPKKFEKVAGLTDAADQAAAFKRSVVKRHPTVVARSYLEIVEYFCAILPCNSEGKISAFTPG
jgi:hypothetical protein